MISETADKRWKYRAISLAGLATFIAPFTLGYDNYIQPLWTGLILGALLVVLDAARLIQPSLTEIHS